MLLAVFADQLLLHHRKLTEQVSQPAHLRRRIRDRLVGLGGPGRRKDHFAP